MSVSIIIVNWNSGNWLYDCIESIKHFGGKSVKEVIVVDNASSDGSMDTISLDKITLIINPENLGFAKACNIGFKAATGNYCLLLNPDTRIFENTINLSVEFLEKNQQIDILGCRHVDKSGKTKVSCARFPKFSTFINDIFGLSKLAPDIFHPATLMTDWDHGESREVDQVMGAFMFMRKSIFDKHGFFDEQFFVYYEELDFSYRVKKNGGKIFYNADCSIYHKENGTTKNVPSFSLFLSIKSRLKFIRKHFPFYQFILLFFATITFEFLIRSLYSLFTGGWSGVKANFLGYKMLVTKYKQY